MTLLSFFFKIFSKILNFKIELTEIIFKKIHRIKKYGITRRKKEIK